MNNYIYVKENAVSEEDCKKAIDDINNSKLYPATTDHIKDFYNGKHMDVYKQEWSKNLFDCVIEYKRQHPFLDGCMAEWRIQPACNYQKYELGQNYKLEHCEQGATESDCRRMLVWMVYLNTIKVGGETCFPQQNIELKPKQGTIVIWPAAWTHSHYGKPALDEHKYIITGWGSHVKL